MAVVEVDKQMRLDQFLAQTYQKSRHQIQAAIKNGFVLVDGHPATKNGLKLKPGQIVELITPLLPPRTPVVWEGGTIEILYEDEDLLVINKPAYLVVHPAPGTKEPTLVDWLKEYGIALSTLGGEERQGIVHRIDKGTTGVLVIAKSNEAHTALAAQLQDKSMGRYYLAIIDAPLKEETIVDRPIGRHPANRLKMGIVAHGRPAKTAFLKLATSIDGRYELIACKLYTGRTHQIRVHLASLGRHIVGDTLYGFKERGDTIKRPFLHAWRLYLTHPRTGDAVSLMAPLFDDMKQFLQDYFDIKGIDETTTLETLDTRFALLERLCAVTTSRIKTYHQ
ncbi:MAG: RluA family pseudouridine synthase [Campylobacterales bacterium]